MPSLRIEEVSFAIGAFRMEEVSLTVEAGGYVVMTGPNGSGKSLLIRLIAGLLEPASGAIAMGERPITGLPPWRRRIGYVPQEGLLFPNRTVRRNIAFALEVRRISRAERRREVEQLAAPLGLERLLDRMPQGLSGGERQRVVLARALAAKPELLLLDEPLSAVHEDARDRLCDELRRVHRETGLTTLHVSQDRREIERLADRVIVMDGGRLSEEPRDANAVDR